MSHNNDRPLAPPATAPPTIVDPQGRPARSPASRACPACGSTKRVLSGGFGADVHDLCAVCGHDFAERTL